MIIKQRNLTTTTAAAKTKPHITLYLQYSLYSDHSLDLSHNTSLDLVSSHVGCLLPEIDLLTPWRGNTSTVIHLPSKYSANYRNVDLCPLFI